MTEKTPRRPTRWYGRGDRPETRKAAPNPVRLPIVAGPPVAHAVATRDRRRRRRPAKLNGTKAEATRAIVEGSGTAWTPGVLLPATVPEEKVALVTVVFAVTPATAREK